MIRLRVPDRFVAAGGDSSRRLNQLQALQTRMAVLADDDVIMHRNPERCGDVDDGAGHLDIGLRRCRVAGGVIVHKATTSRIMWNTQ
jgi:hypothetical protein